MTFTGIPFYPSDRFYNNFFGESNYNIGIVRSYSGSLKENRLSDYLRTTYTIYDNLNNNIESGICYDTTQIDVSPGRYRRAGPAYTRKA